MIAGLSTALELRILKSREVGTMNVMLSLGLVSYHFMFPGLRSDFDALNEYREALPF